jgi:hypothetical protein
VSLALGAWALWGAVAGKLLLGFLLAAWLADLIVLAVRYVRQRDDSGQIGVLVIGAYGVLLALLSLLAARGVDPGALVSAMVALSWVGMGVALLVLAALHWSQQRRALAIGVLLLALLAVALALLGGMLIGSRSSLARALADPRAYAGPVGWLAGCAPAPRQEPQATREVEEEVAAVKETVVVEKEVEVTRIVEVEKEVEKVVTQIVEEPAAPSPPPTRALDAQPGLPLPTPSEAATPTSPATPAAPAERPVRPTALPAPSPEPPLPLLGQVAAETIYWVPEVITDDRGRFVVEFPLPDVPATWRLSVLASTLDGALGEADLLLPADP